MNASKKAATGPSLTPPLSLANATKITDNIWVGGELDSADPEVAQRQLTELIDAGVDTIIDCRIERDDSGWVTQANPQIDYLSIGVEDAGYAMPGEWFDDGTEYAIDQITSGHVVLVHCQAGINRGPSMVFALLLASGWDAIEALDLIHARRPIARIAYAEDAMSWWLGKAGAVSQESIDQLAQVRQWRARNGWSSRSQYRGSDGFDGQIDSPR